MQNLDGSVMDVLRGFKSAHHSESLGNVHPLFSMSRGAFVRRRYFSNSLFLGMNIDATMQLWLSQGPTPPHGLPRPDRGAICNPPG